MSDEDEMINQSIRLSKKINKMIANVDTMTAFSAVAIVLLLLVDDLELNDEREARAKKMHMLTMLHNAMCDYLMKCEGNDDEDSSDLHSLQ